MKLLGVRPAGQASHGIELPQQLSDELFRIVFRAQLIELPEHARERLIGVADRAFGKYSR